MQDKLQTLQSKLTDEELEKNNLILKMSKAEKELQESQKLKEVINNK